MADLEAEEKSESSRSSEDSRYRQGNVSEPEEEIVFGSEEEGDPSDPSVESGVTDRTAQRLALLRRNRAARVIQGIFSRGRVPKMPTKTVTINGIPVEVLDTAIDESKVVVEPALKKEGRSKLRDDKWLYLKATMESGLESKFTEVSMSETDLSVLENTYELVQQNKKVVQHLQDWDMTDVFTLVLGVDASNDAQTKDLLNDWPTITVDEVVKSNVWYNTNTSKTVAPWVRQNLEISHKFLINSCDDDMSRQLLDLLVEYKPAQRGGPLTFKLLMDLIQVNSERSIKHLIESVKRMDVKNFDGENIVDVVAQIRGAYTRLKMVSFGAAAGTGTGTAVPMNFNEDVMDVLQTTSTETFNAAFDYKTMRATRRLTSGGTPINPSVEEILKIAVDLYHDMESDNSWLGKNHKAKEIAMPAKIDVSQGNGKQKRKGKCFNCGEEGHMLKDCKKPENLEMQAKLRKEQRAEWKANKRTGNGGRGGGGRGGGRGGGGRGRGEGGRGSGRGGGGTNKWCPPASHENGRRLINVRGTLIPHKYNAETKRWDAERASGLVANGGGGGTVPTHIPGTPPTQGSASELSPTPSQAHVRAHIANLQREMQQSFSELLRKAGV